MLSHTNFEIKYHNNFISNDFPNIKITNFLSVFMFICEQLIMFKKFTLSINNFPMDECNCASCAFSYSEHIMDMSNICHWPQIPSIGQSVCGSVMSCFTFNSFHFSCQYMSNHYYLCNMLIVRRLGAKLTQQVAEVIVGSPMKESIQTSIQYQKRRC